MQIDGLHRDRSAQKLATQDLVDMHSGNVTFTYQLQLQQQQHASKHIGRRIKTKPSLMLTKPFILDLASDFILGREGGGGE